MDGTFDTRPIGIFDSGVGGLTVLRTLAKRFPHEHFLYLGDTARVPYGTKSARTVERYTVQVANFLLERGVKALVAACNTASALGLPALRAHCRAPVMGVIQPGCRAALVALTQKGTAQGTVGIIGTRSTIASGMYPRFLAQSNPQVQALSLACPLFVPLVEEGWIDHPATHMIVHDTLKRFTQVRPDVLILGCTHYPLLKPRIADVLGPSVTLIDSADAVADALQRLLEKKIIPAPVGRHQQLAFLVTDVAERFKEVATLVLGGLPIDHIEMVDL